MSPPVHVAPPILEEPPPQRVEPAPRVEATARAPAKAPPPPAPRAATAPGAEGWSVQLAAYSSEAPALALRDSLARTWPDTRVQRAEVGGRQVWRVRVGNFSSRREADEAGKRLAASGYRVIVVEAGRP